jgi:uncharacterized protein (TIGR03437 family)
VRVDEAGNLVLVTAAGEVRWAKPVIYQLVDGRRAEIAGAFRVHQDKSVSFSLAAYDRTKTLIIDPTVTFATYWGGPSNEAARGIAVDASGNIYVAGYTTSNSLATTAGTAQTGYGGNTQDSITGDAFILKLNAAGTSAIWLTYLGGQQDDVASGIALDGSGNIYVTGMTNSTNFPTRNAQNATYLGARGNILNPMGDAFLTKLNSSGTIVYSTYFGGTGDDWGMAVAVDSSGNAYITGATLSTNLPIGANTYQKNFKGSGGSLDFCSGCGPIFLTGDAFATKYDPNGKLVWTTYIGGSKDDIGTSIAVDRSGNVYVGGFTISTDFPTTTGAFQTKFGGVSDNQSQPNIHSGDAFLVKLDPNGANLLLGTYIGGSKDDAISSIALDSSNNVYMTGSTASSDFPTTSAAFQTTFKGPSQAQLTSNMPTFLFGDAWVAKLNAAGSSLVYSTYLGGSGDDAAEGIAVDSNGNAYIAGHTNSRDFPLKSATQGAWAGSGGQTQAFGDAFVAQLDSNGNLLFSTYLGGNADDAAGAIAIDSSGNAYVTGYTISSNFPVTKGSFQTTYNGSTRAGNPYGDVFVAKISGLNTGGAPSILPNGVVPVYSTATTIQPGNWFSIYGSNLATSTAVWNGDFPTGLNGTTVTIDNKPAYLWFVSSGQINAQAPDDTATGSVPVVVSTPSGSVTSTVNLAPASPSLLLLPDGKHVTGIIITPNGNGSQGGGPYDLLGPTSLGPGYRPARLGEPVAIYAVGLGPTNPPVPAGKAYSCPASGCATLAATPQLNIGGTNVSVLFAGVVSAGLYQINFNVPIGIGTGDQPVSVTVSGGLSTQGAVSIPLQ